MAKPTVGRMVHYVDQGGVHLAAVVVAVEGKGPDAGRVNLTLFGSMPGQVMGARNVKQDEETKATSTWHWPEREE